TRWIAPQAVPPTKDRPLASSKVREPQSRSIEGEKMKAPPKEKAAAAKDRAASQDHYTSADHSPSPAKAQRNGLNALPRPESLLLSYGPPDVGAQEVKLQFTTWPRFVTWAVRCGYAPPERLAELIERELAEVR